MSTGPAGSQPAQASQPSTVHLIQLCVFTHIKLHTFAVHIHTLSLTHFPDTLTATPRPPRGVSFLTLTLSLSAPCTLNEVDAKRERAADVGDGAQEEEQLTDVPTHLHPTPYTLHPDAKTPSMCCTVCFSISSFSLCFSLFPLSLPLCRPPSLPRSLPPSPPPRR